MSWLHEKIQARDGYILWKQWKISIFICSKIRPGEIEFQADNNHRKPSVHMLVGKYRWMWHFSHIQRRTGSSTRILPSTFQRHNNSWSSSWCEIWGHSHLPIRNPKARHHLHSTQLQHRETSRITRMSNWCLMNGKKDIMFLTCVCKRNALYTKPN